MNLPVFLKSIVLSFSMFSKIPMPNVEWNEKNMRYMMCFFPFVGLFISLSVSAVFFALSFFHAEYGLFQAEKINSRIMLALFLTLFPIAVTGGIHLDGFMDTSDALGSHAPVDRKLEILKDSHVGSFAVLNLSIYLLSYFVLSFCLSNDFFDSIFLSENFQSFFSFLPFCSVFFVSRLMSALAVAVFPKAKNSGLARSFSDSASKLFTVAWCLFFLALSFFTLVFFFGWKGLSVVLSSLLVFAFYFFMSKKEFGGTTGDLAGWFLQVCELAGLFSFVIVS